MEGYCALFGGSFDPPHLGHRAIVQGVLRHPDITKVIVMPAWLNPFKERSHATPEQRLRWCRTVLDLPGVEISDWEIRQRRPVYTIETWEYLKSRKLPLRYLVIGSDNLPTITAWHKFERLNDEVVWIVATREEEPPDISPLKRAELLRVEVPVSSTMIRRGEGLEYLDPRIRDEVIAVYGLETNKKESM